MSNPIGEILSNRIGLRHGYQFRESDFTENGIQVIKIGNVTDDGLKLDTDISFVSADRLKEFESIIIKDSDILMSLTGNIGRVVEVKNLNGKILFQNYRVGVFYPLDEEIYKPFIKWVLGSEGILRQLSNYSNQSAQANFGKQDLDKLRFLFPKHNQQQQIAKILSTADAVIEKTQAAIAKYKAIKQGMLQDLFTRVIDLNTNKLRPRYQDAPELYKESKLGMIPREWEVERIDTQAKITTGSKDTQNKIEHGVYPFFVRSQTVEKIDSYTYDGEAILTSGDGVGVGKIYHYINGKFDFHQRVYMLYEFEKTISPKFLFYYFSNNFLAVVEKYSAKNTVDSVRMEMIAGMIIPLPPINEQKQISERLNAIDNKLQTEQTYLQKMQSLKKGLMEDLLSGRKCLNLDFQDEQINQDSKTILQSVNLVNQDADNYPVNPKIE